MNQTQSILAAGVFTIAGAILPLLAEAAVAGTSSLDLFGRWVQAGGTVGMVGVLLWIRAEEKARREKEEARREAEERAQQERFDKLLANTFTVFERQAAISERFALRASGLEEEMHQLAVEVRLLSVGDPDRARRVMEKKAANVPGA